MIGSRLANETLVEGTLSRVLYEDVPLPRMSSGTSSQTLEISMNHWPVQVTLIDSHYTQGAPAELGVLSSDFREEPPQTITIYDVTWVRTDPKFLAPVLHRESVSRPRVGYRSTSPVTPGFLRYLNYVLTYPYAAQRMAIQPMK